MFKLWIFLWSIMAFNLIEASGPSSPSTKDADSAAASTSGLTETQTIDQFFRNAQFDLKKTIDPKTQKEVSASYINISRLKSKPEDILRRAKDLKLFQSAGKIQEDLYERYKDFKDIEITLDQDNLIIFSPSRSAIKNLLVRSILRDANLVSAKDQAQVLDKTSVKEEYQKDFDFGYKASVDFSELTKDQSAYIKPKIIDSILKLDQKEFTRTNLPILDSSVFIYSLFPENKTLKTFDTQLGVNSLFSEDKKLKTFDIHIGVTGKIDLEKTFQDLKDLINKIPSQADRAKEQSTLNRNLKSLSEKFVNIMRPLSDKEKKDLMPELKDFSKETKDASKKTDESYTKAKKLFEEIQNKLIIIDLKLPENPSDPEIQKIKNDYDTLKTNINPFISDLNIYRQGRQLVSTYSMLAHLMMYQNDFIFLGMKIDALLKERNKASIKDKAKWSAQMISLYKKMQSIFTEKIDPLNPDRILLLDAYETRAKGESDETSHTIKLSNLLQPLYLSKNTLKKTLTDTKQLIDAKTPSDQGPSGALDGQDGQESPESDEDEDEALSQSAEDEALAEALSESAEDEANAAQNPNISLDEAKAAQSRIKESESIFISLPANSRSAYDARFQNALKTINELVIALDYIETAQNKVDDAGKLNNLEAAQTAQDFIKNLRNNFNNISPNIKDLLENRFATVETQVNTLVTTLSGSGQSDLDTEAEAEAEAEANAEAETLTQSAEDEANAAQNPNISLDQAKAAQISIQKKRASLMALPVNIIISYEDRFQNAEKTINELVIALDYIETANKVYNDARTTDLEAAVRAQDTIKNLRNNFNNISPNIKDLLENRFATVEKNLENLLPTLMPAAAQDLFNSGGLLTKAITQADLDPKYQNKRFSKGFKINFTINDFLLEPSPNVNTINNSLSKIVYPILAKKFNEMYTNKPFFPYFTPIDPQKALIYFKELHDNQNLILHFIELEE